MERIEISTPSQNSVITCGNGAFAAFLPELEGKSLFVITDSNVNRYYGKLIEDSFRGAPVHVIPAGEGSKNYSRLQAILKHMIAVGATRKTTVIALGGGVVGDIAGLAASLYMRGVAVVQIPTTLLSQVDSSVGGKTAVDMCGVKNVVGSFYQPERVVVDPAFLATLPRRELRCGLGEIVKYGALNADIYRALIKNSSNLFRADFLESIVAPCIRHKAKVVAEDERDAGGARKTLNLGHTTGHAFELYYKRKSHGEFVLVGMYYELYIAERAGLCGGEYANSLRTLIKKVINKIPAYKDASEAANNARYDKKNDVQSEVSVVVPVSEGVCSEYRLPIAEYAKLIGECASSLN